MRIESQEYLKLAEDVFSGEQVVVFPSMGEYPVYDDLTYRLMCRDKVRITAYDNALKKIMPGKTAVDIGTGDRAPLAVMCAKAGAEKVYAIEKDEKSALKAEKTVFESGLSNIITIFHGDSTQIELPEKVDVCVSEIIGNIGSSEGAAAILNNAKRFLKPAGKMVPEKCLTRIAPASLPENIFTNDAINELTDYYVHKVYESLGEIFPITRFVYYNFPEDNIIACPLVFENDEYNLTLQTEISNELRFEVRKDCSFDGFLLWINLHVDSENIINSLHESFWGPVFFRTESIQLKAGDEIIAVCERKLSKNNINPDYFIRGTAKYERTSVHKFPISSYHTSP